MSLSGRRAGAIGGTISFHFRLFSQPSGNAGKHAAALVREWDPPPHTHLAVLGLWLLLISLSGGRGHPRSSRDAAPGPERADAQRLKTWTWPSEPVDNGDLKSWRGS